MTDASENATPYFPDSHQSCTHPLYLFLNDYHRVMDLFFFTVHLASRTDETAEIARKALFKTARSEEEKAKYQEKNSSTNSEKLAGFASINSRNITNNIVDSFLWYISTLIQEAIKRRPETIKSGEAIKIEDIFDYKNKKELLNYLIDRKINSLSYGGMKAIESFVKDSLGIDFFESEEQRKLMQIFIEIRNINAHNRGRANRIFLSRVSHDPRFDFKEGKLVFLDYEKIVLLSQVCVNTALSFDKRIATKFGVRRKRYTTWKAEQNKISTSKVETPQAQNGEGNSGSSA